MSSNNGAAVGILAGSGVGQKPRSYRRNLNEFPTEVIENVVEFLWLDDAIALAVTCRSLTETVTAHALRLNRDFVILSGEDGDAVVARLHRLARSDAWCGGQHRLVVRLEPHTIPRAVLHDTHLRIRSRALTEVRRSGRGVQISEVVWVAFLIGEVPLMLEAWGGMVGRVAEFLRSSRAGSIGVVVDVDGMESRTGIHIPRVDAKGCFGCLEPLLGLGEHVKVAGTLGVPECGDFNRLIGARGCEMW